MAARLFSMGISHHSLLPQVPSICLSAVKSSPHPGIAPQSLNSSSHPLCDLGYVWLQQGLSDSHSSSVQSLSRLRLFATPWTAAYQASLSITNSRSLHKFMSIELVMPSNHLIVRHPLLSPSIFPASGSFQMGQFFASGGQSIGVSASTSVLPMNIQDSFPLG